MEKREKIIIKIEGMHCGGCVARVEKALKSIKAVKNFSVDLEKKSAEIETVGDIFDIIKEKLENIGFEVSR